MIKLKKLVSESTWSRKFGEPLPTIDSVMKKHKVEEATPTPLASPHDFKKPTVVHMSKDELITLYKTGTLETDGLTIIYGD
jgi:hypothetical protein|tara:strand:+ start:299 stop:541 length:243 start_codon:yes stop_codon:yes gene_type:complete